MNGEGGLYQRSDGRWFGAVVLGYDASGKPKRKTVSAKTKAEALQKLKDLQDKIDGGYSPPTKGRDAHPALRSLVLATS